MNLIERVKRRIFKSFYNKEILGTPTETEKHFISELRNNIRGLAPLKAEYGTKAEENWIAHRNNIRDLVINKDPRDFLNWKVIKASMFYEPSVNELRFLQKLSDWDKYKNAIVESKTGNPTPYYAFKKSSANLIHHAYGLSQLLNGTKFSFKSVDYILELGGGYGSMCRLCYNMGYKGKYVIFDFPEFLSIQKYFLNSINISAEFYDQNRPSSSSVILVSEINDLSKIFNINSEDFLLIATWSLSETPLAFRELFLSKITSPSYFLIGYQNQFGEVSNVEYFEKFKSEYKMVTWKENLVPDLPKNSYLVGWVN